MEEHWWEDVKRIKLRPSVSWWGYIRSSTQPIVSKKHETKCPDRRAILKCCVVKEVRHSQTSIISPKLRTLDCQPKMSLTDISFVPLVQSSHFLGDISFSWRNTHKEISLNKKGRQITQIDTLQNLISGYSQIRRKIRNSCSARIKLLCRIMTVKLWDSGISRYCTIFNARDR